MSHFIFFYFFLKLRVRQKFLVRHYVKPFMITHDEFERRQEEAKVPLESVFRRVTTIIVQFIGVSSMVDAVSNRKINQQPQCFYCTLQFHKQQPFVNVTMD